MTWDRTTRRDRGRVHWHLARLRSLNHDPESTTIEPMPRGFPAECIGFFSAGWSLGNFPASSRTSSALMEESDFESARQGGGMAKTARPQRRNDTAPGYKDILYTVKDEVAWVTI